MAKNSIQEAAKKIGAWNRFFMASTLKRVSKLLNEFETVENMVVGFYDKKGGLLIATNYRVLYVTYLLGNLEVVDIPIKNIQMIKFDNHWTFGRIEIVSSYKSIVVEKVNRKHAPGFVQCVRNHM